MRSYGKTENLRRGKRKHLGVKRKRRCDDITEFPKSRVLTKTPSNLHPGTLSAVDCLRDELWHDHSRTWYKTTARLIKPLHE